MDNERTIPSTLSTPTDKPEETNESFQSLFTDQLLVHFKSGKFSDVILEVDGTEIKSHKVLLSSQSPVFSALFDHEIIGHRIVIEHVDKEIVEQMLEFVYTNKPPTKIDEFADELMVLAKKYQMEKLKSMCIQVLAEKLTFENVLPTFIHACLNEAEQLKEYIFEFIEKNDIIFTPSYFKDLEKSQGKVAAKICRNAWLTILDKVIVGNDLINQLDHDCLAKIFTYLPLLDRFKMERVCKKWKEAGQLPWSDVKKIDHDYLMTIPIDKRNKALEKIIKRCGQNLTHIKIDYDSQIILYNGMKDNCQNIIHFDIDITIEDDEIITCETVVEMIRSMPKLKYLRVEIGNFDNYPTDFTHVCSLILEQLPKHMEDICLLLFSPTENSIVECPKFPPIPDDKLNNLRRLTLHGFCLEHNTIKSILLKKDTLIYLHLVFCYFPSGDVSSMLSNLVKLEHLNLEQNGNLNDNLLIAIAHNCPQLKHLDFSTWVYSDDQQNIPYRCFRELKYLKNLQHLRCGKVDVFEGEDLISLISNNCEKLKYLDVGKGFNFSASDFHEITKFKNLEYLNLASARPDSQVLISILSNCLKLKNLYMEFGDMSEDALEKLSNLKKLEELNFSHCENLTGNVLTKIAINCKNLVELDISNCKNVTEASLIRVGNLHNLKKLSLEGIENVPNDMFNNFHKLTWLSVQGCPSVTDEGVKKVIDNCKNLKYLYLRESKITTESLVHASKRPFPLTILCIFVDDFLQHDYNRRSFYMRINEYDT